MSGGGCLSPIPWAVLVDYWAADLPTADAEAIEAHVFGCQACAAESARVASVTEAIRRALPPVITRETLSQLAAQGTRIRENVVSPDERRQIPFPADVDLLIHRLSGIDLSDAERIAFVLRDEKTGTVVASMDPAPFDRAEGAVLVACERHNIQFPHDTIAELRIHGRATVRRVAYTILHQYL